ncbi:MAG: hypothetical protein V2I38_09495, partial [Alcanivoracaceae bacterium]|nr:hypothetical protein [Alcanivoracaceae bacterium]
RARPLVDGLQITAEAKLVESTSGWQTQGTVTVNGQPAANGYVLMVGDRIAMPGDGEALLIEVQS